MSDTGFSSFGLDQALLNAIHKIGFTKPTEVQEKVIPKLKNGIDLIVLSKTGSGKTAAFAIPIIDGLIKTREKTALRAVCLTPTRELAQQVEMDFMNLSAGSGLKTVCVYGQHNMNEEIKQIDKGVDILCGTPGRVLDHLKNGVFSLDKIEYFVLDEADRMLAMGFIEQVSEILEYAPKDRKTLLFSATMPPEIMDVCWRYMREPEEIVLESPTKTVDKIKQLFYLVRPQEKRTALYKLLALYRPQSLLIFCNTRWQVDRITGFLNEKGLAARGIHGGISQAGRTKTLSQFKSGMSDILVATDVAARGIHVENLEMVINFDVPNEKDNYVHRIGRTGRVGKDGIALTLACSEDLFALYEIEEHIGCRISEVDFPADDKMKEAFRLMREQYGPAAAQSKAKLQFKRQLKKEGPVKRNKQDKQDKPDKHDKPSKKDGHVKTKEKDFGLKSKLPFKSDNKDKISKQGKMPHTKKPPFDRSARAAGYENDRENKVDYSEFSFSFKQDDSVRNKKIVASSPEGRTSASEKPKKKLSIFARIFRRK